MLHILHFGEMSNIFHDFFSNLKWLILRWETKTPSATRVEYLIMSWHLTKPLDLIIACFFCFFNMKFKLKFLKLFQIWLRSQLGVRRFKLFGSATEDRISCRRLHGRQKASLAKTWDGPTPCKLTPNFICNINICFTVSVIILVIRIDAHRLKIYGERVIFPKVFFVTFYWNISPMYVLYHTPFSPSHHHLCMYVHFSFSLLYKFSSLSKCLFCFYFPVSQTKTKPNQNLS